MTLKERIKAGQDGKYTGLSNGLGGINSHIYNVQRGYFTLIGGQSGSAKTALLDFILMNALEDAAKHNIKLDIFYYSYEINKDTKKLNWLSIHIYKKYQVEIGAPKIAGLGGLTMTEAEQALVDAEVDYIEELFEKINFRFDPTNPTGIYHELVEHAAKNGTFIKEYYTNELGEKKPRITGYTPTDPESYTIAAIDHIALAKKEKNYDLKQNIDKLSEYFIFIRNICKYTFFALQQFNSSLSSMDRLKLKGMDISPQQSDFKDSTNIYTDADLVLGLMNPWKMDFKVFMGHDLNIIKDKYRLIKLIKSRVGRDNQAFSYVFNGGTGTFKMLPKAEDIDDLFGGYDEYLK